MFMRQSGSLLRRRLRYLLSTNTITTTTKTTTSGLSSHPLPSNAGFLHRNGPAIPRWQKHHWDSSLWILLSGQAAIIVGANGNLAFADDVSAEARTGAGGDGSSDLQRVEDGSVISNIHTSKWRVFTDKARDFFLEGKLVEAEKLFLSAVEEAKEGFGKSDPHVAAALNNLAELYRVKKDFAKAEPLYLEAVHILEESFGLDDIRVAASLHNLGQFYIVQRKLEEAHKCYERALKIKRRVLGQNHTDYANTMYHLGTVKYLQGKENDSVALIQDSIKILEESGLGQSVACLRRLRYLAQVFLKFNRLSEAENVQRKILHIREISKV
ncbi:hypothetical protein MKX03_007662 [Papaver bracteatum]|nr:hypothetical protein MKX03_007662 [Papaver bracteatum]